MDVLFLTGEEVMAIHHDEINRYGGSHGLRDAGLLASALAMPVATFAGEYLHPDIAANGSRVPVSSRFKSPIH